MEGIFFLANLIVHLLPHMLRNLFQVSRGPRLREPLLQFGQELFFALGELEDLLVNIPATLQVGTHNGNTLNHLALIPLKIQCTWHSERSHFVIINSHRKESHLLSLVWIDF